MGPHPAHRTPELPVNAERSSVLVPSAMVPECLPVHLTTLGVPTVSFKSRECMFFSKFTYLSDPESTKIDQNTNSSYDWMSTVQ